MMRTLQCAVLGDNGLNEARKHSNTVALGIGNPAIRNRVIGGAGNRHSPSTGLSRKDQDATFPLQNLRTIKKTALTSGKFRQ